MSLHRETTRQLAALMPFVLRPALSPRGAHIGDDLFGRPFHFDPIRFREEPDLGLHDPNLLVLGQIGMGKSALVKLLAARLSVFGYSTAYLDPKGETSALAGAFGAEPVRLRPGGGDRLNPFDAVAAAGDRQSVELAFECLLAAMLQRRLTLGERRTLSEALSSLLRAGGRPTLADLQSRLVAGGESDLSLALWSFLSGAGRGLFDGESTTRSEKLRFLAVDLSAVLGTALSDPVRSALVAMVSLWLSAAIRSLPPPRLFILDEAWALLRDPSAAEWLQRQWKLARSLAVANVAVLHRLSDLDSAGVGRPLALGLLADTQTRVIFRQPSSELTLLRDWLGLTAPELEVVTSLPRGWALWKLANRSFVVQLHVHDRESHLVDTDHALSSATTPLTSGSQGLLGPVPVPLEGPNAL